MNVISLTVTGAPEGWRARLVEELQGNSLEIRDEGAVGAVPVVVALTESVEAAVTDSGVSYHAAVIRAHVRIRRAGVRLESRPGVAAARDEALRIAREDVLERIAESLTL